MALEEAALVFAVHANDDDDECDHARKALFKAARRFVTLEK